MSQIAGGRADKCGNAFERLWIVYLALNVVEGLATSIKWEPLGPEGAGIECEVTLADGTREMHQCKINNGTDGKWTAADLLKVLAAARVHLESDSNTKFFFISRDPAPALDDLADRARHCDGSGSDFFKYCQQTSKAHKASYKSLCECWGLSPTEEVDAVNAIRLLSRINFDRGYWGHSEVQRLYRVAESISDGDGESIITYLGAHLERTLGNTHHSDELRSVLREAGYPPININSDPTLPSSIEQLQNIFRSVLSPHLICSQILSRPEPEQLVTRATADGGARLIFLTGDAGSGKSGVLLDAINLLHEKGVPYLPIRLDTHYPEGTVRTYYKEQLNLAASPCICLQALAAGRRAVLIVDQLDAIRWTATNSDSSWVLCLEMLNEALRIPNMSVVVVGRSVDFDDDVRINHWKSQHEKGQKVDVEQLVVGSLPEKAIVEVLNNYGINYAVLLPKEKELLSNAQSLQLWWRLAEDGKVGTFSSRADLLSSFWFHYRNKASTIYGATISQVNGLLSQLVVYMDRHGRLDAPNILVGQHIQAANALRSLGIIEKGNCTTRFAHQSYLDYLTVEQVLIRVASEELAPIDWLRNHDQALFRRDQVRFLLQLLRGQNHDIYLSFLEDIFYDANIRFHIQHLALATLANSIQPTEGEYMLVKRLLTEDKWHQHVLQRVLEAHPEWLNRFTQDGTIPNMMNSEDEAVRSNALILCKRSAVAAPEWFEQILFQHWNSNDSQWVALINQTLSYEPGSDTSTAFGWRLECLRSWADDHDIYTSNQLAEVNEARAIQHMAAAIEGLTSNIERTATSGGARRVELGSRQFSNLTNACIAQARLAWETLLPVYKSAIELDQKFRIISGSHAQFDSLYSLGQLIAFSHDLLKTTGNVLLNSEEDLFLADVTTLASVPASVHLRRLAVDILASTPANLADDAVICFLGIDCPLDIETPSELMTKTDCLTPQDPAIDTLSILSSACSDEVLKSIEHLVLKFHSTYERESIKWQLEMIRSGTWTGDYPNHYGLPQYSLLLALPQDRLSEKALRVLRTWQRKFGDLRRYRSTGTVEARPLASPIPTGKSKYVADSTWLQIVSNDWSDRKHEWRETNHGYYIEASPYLFALSLEEAGQLGPGHYIQLGLRFSPNADSCYYSSLLRVATITVAPKDSDEKWEAACVEDIEALIEHISEKNDVQIAQGICRVVSERSEEPWQGKTLDLLHRFALTHSDPEGRSSSDTVMTQGGISSLEVTALNSVRCLAVSAAAHLLWSHPQLLSWAISLAEEVIKDSHPAVRAASFELAYAICKHDINISCSLMVRAYMGSNVCILGAHYSQILLRFLWKREIELVPIFEQAMASSDQKTVQTASYWITIGNVMENLYIGLANLAANGPTEARIGVVSAIVDLAKHQDDLRSACLDKLRSFLNGVDDRVLETADRIFFQEGILSKADIQDFAINFVNSDAFQRDPSAFLGQLREYEGSLIPYADAIEAAVSQLSGPTLRNKTQSLANRQGMAGSDISTILLRLYQHSERDNNTDLRSRCLDHWDSLLRAGVGTGQDVLDRLDSWSGRGEGVGNRNRILFAYHPAQAH